jgi:hypothetical protein
MNEHKNLQTPLVSQVESRRFEDLGILIPRTYLPRPGVDLAKWAVVACDQFTSQPEYWNAVAGMIGEAPSTLKLTLPEVYLGKPEEPERIHSIQASMSEYLDAGILVPQEGLIYVGAQVWWPRRGWCCAWTWKSTISTKARRA